MANYLSAAKYNLDKAKKELESALDTLAQRPSSPGGRRATDILNSINITDGMAKVFSDKPVIIIQHADVRIQVVNNQINSALRALEKVDNLSIRALATKQQPGEEKDG